MADEITDDQIAELRRLHEAATPDLEVIRYAHGGGRVFGRDGRGLVADFYGEADRECWIAARNALPALLSRLERAEKERDEAREELTNRIASIMHNPDVDGTSLAAELIREGMERGRAESAARVATLEAALREEHAILEQEYGHGVANGYFPDIAPVLDRGRAALRGVEGK